MPLNKTYSSYVGTSLQICFQCRTMAKSPFLNPNFILSMTTDSDNLLLLREPSEEDIQSINWSKAPGIDGYSGKFFHEFWHLIRTDILAYVILFSFANSCLDHEVDKTTIILISKKPYASRLSDFRPISFCTVQYIILAKLLVHRLRPLMSKCMSPT